MKLTLQREGVALTAPQLGLPHRATLGSRQATRFNSLRAGTKALFTAKGITLDRKNRCI